MQAKKTTDASSTPAKDRLPAFARRYHAHSPAAGRNASSDVPFSATIPHSSPNSNQGSKPSRSSMVSVSQKRIARSSAERLVSHTARVHQNIMLGSKAQAHADPTATFSENMRRAIRKIGTHVSAEHTLLKVRITNAEAFE